jgi:hypothetical protein
MRIVPIQHPYTISKQKYIFYTPSYLDFERRKVVLI